MYSSLKAKVDRSSVVHWVMEAYISKIDISLDDRKKIETTTIRPLGFHASSARCAIAGHVEL